jgi:hypothetical protein
VYCRVWQRDGVVHLKRNLVKQEGENWGNEAHAKVNDMRCKNDKKEKEV